MNILHIDCSPRAQSHSRQLSAAIVERLIASNPTATTTRRDLGLEPIPHAQADYAEALSSPAALAAALSEGEAMGLSEILIREIEAADAVVIGTAMNNFTVPSVLKAWIDQIVRAGRTFMPSPTGKVGLLADRPMFIAIASGAAYTGDQARQPDFLTPYLTAVLGCVGLKTLHFLPLQATARLDQARSATLRGTLLADIEAMVRADDGGLRPLSSPVG